MLCSLDINQKLKESGLDESILYANGHAPSTPNSAADGSDSLFESKVPDDSSEDESSSDTEDETSTSDSEDSSDETDSNEPSAADWYREYLGRLYKATTKVCLCSVFPLSVSNKHHVF